MYALDRCHLSGWPLSSPLLPYGGGRSKGGGEQSKPTIDINFYHGKGLTSCCGYESFLSFTSGCGNKLCPALPRAR